VSCHRVRETDNKALTVSGQSKVVRFSYFIGELMREKCEDFGVCRCCWLRVYCKSKICNFIKVILEVYTKER